MDSRKTLEVLTANYEKAIASGDAEAASEFFSENGMFLLQGIPVVLGKAQLLSLHQEWVDRKQVGTHKILTCEETGNMAYAAGIFSVQFQNDKGETEKFSGKYMDVFRRQPRGPWKIHASCAFTD